MKRALPGTALLGTVALAASACGAATRATVPPPGQHASAAALVVRSSRLVLGGHVRVTATVGTPVQVGHALEVTFAVRNVSKRPRRIQLGYANLWLVVRGADGTTYDTRVPLREEIGPYITPTTLRPGQTVTRSMPYLRVRWSGPLRITPGWSREALSALRVAVTAPGPPPDGPTAVADVVAASGHLLDHCRPQSPGVAVRGRIDPPGGSAPPLRARCSVSIRGERGFLVAQVLVVTPPGLQGVHVRQPYEQLSSLGSGRTGEAIAWEFVVTRQGATSVDSAEADTTLPADRMAPDWSWTGSRWEGPGGSRCGGSGGGGGGPAGPLISFVSVCPS